MCSIAQSFAGESLSLRTSNVSVGAFVCQPRDLIYRY
jgi:hypothetical protein